MDKQGLERLSFLRMATLAWDSRCSSGGRVSVRLHGHGTPGVHSHFLNSAGRVLELLRGWWLLGFRELHGNRRVVFFKGPLSPQRPRGMAMATSPSLSASLSLSVFFRGTSGATFSVCSAVGPWSCWPQPLGGAKTQGRNMYRFNVRV